MFAFFCLEASQSKHNCRRLAMGAYIPVEMASVILVLCFGCSDRKALREIGGPFCPVKGSFRLLQIS